MIRPLNPHQPDEMDEAARILVEEFREFAPDAWPDLASARAEIADIVAKEGFLFAAFDPSGALIGWAGGLPLNGVAAWELHPLVVSGATRKAGTGRALVDAVSREAGRRGGAVLFAGSDDETGGTSIGGKDLWDDPLAHLARIKNLKNHPYEFYLRIGFKLVGVLPDASGPGKPDIWLARKIEAS